MIREAYKQELLDRRNELEQELLTSIPDTMEYNALYEEWQQVCSELVFLQDEEEDEDFDDEEASIQPLDFS